MKKLSTLLALALTVSLLLNGIAFAADKDTVIVGCAAEPDCFFSGHTTLNTNMDEVPILHNVYESLIKLGPNNERESLLATEWSVSEDGKTYTVKLREGVKFSNGNDFNAEDAALALNLYGPSPNGTAQLGNYDHTEVVDEYTIAIHLTDPYAPFLNALAGRYALMFDKETFEEIGEDAYNDHPIGTGPYLFTERVTGDHVQLDYNPNYWGRRTGHQACDLEGADRHQHPDDRPGERRHRRADPRQHRRSAEPDDRQGQVGSQGRLLHREPAVQLRQRPRRG